MAKGRREPTGAIVALITAAASLFAMRRDPKGLGQDRVLRGASTAIGSGGLVWLVWAAHRRRFSQRED